MYRLTILYGHPSDPGSFDDYYESIHLPIATRMRGLKRWTITKPENGLDGEPPTFHLVVELCAETREQLELVLGSAEGQAAVADVSNFADGGVTFLFGSEKIMPVDGGIATTSGDDVR